MQNWIQKRCELTPNRIAIVYEDATYTYEQLNNHIEKRARFLQQHGVKKGEHFGVFIRNPFEFMVTFWAGAMLGAVGVLFNTRLTKRELQFQEKDSQVIAVFVDDDVTNVFTKAIQLTDDEFEEEVLFVQEWHEDEPMTILYTSGTTGLPKGVVLTYGNHFWSAQASLLNLGLHDDDCWLVCLPLFHVGGLSTLIKGVIYGMKVVLTPKYDHREVAKLCKREEVTHISLVNKMLAELLELPRFLQYAPTMRCLLIGGGPVSKSLLDTCTSLHIPIIQTYGMTETASQVITLSKDEFVTKVGSCGKPLFPVEVQIRNEGSVCQPYEYGELFIKGPMVMKQYWGYRSLEEWLRTGDIAYKDEEGFFYIVDRRNDLIISGGENIYPVELERVIQMHENIEEVAIIGIPDENWGSVPCAFIVLKNKELYDEGNVKRYCEANIARYKVPKVFVVVEELPRTANGKLKRYELKKWWESRNI